MLNHKSNPDLSVHDLQPVTRQICDGNLQNEWSVTPIGDSIGRGTLGIYRVTGTSLTPVGDINSWSIVLKIVDIEKDFDGLREYQLSLSSSLRSIANGIRPAVCYGTQIRPEGERWIWFEDLTHTLQTPWSDSVYLNVARDVGKFHASSLSGFSKDEWDYNGIHGAVIAPWGLAEILENLDQVTSNSLAAIMFSQTNVDTVGSLLAKHQEVATELKKISTVLAHNDCHAANLFPVESNGVHQHTVAIDWATVGLGPLGEDAGDLIADAIKNFHLDSANILELEESFFSSYVDGLMVHNSYVNLDHARTGYLAGMGYWGLCKMMMVANATQNVAGYQEIVEQRTGQPAEQVMDRHRSTVARLIPYAIECVQRLGL